MARCAVGPLMTKCATGLKVTFWQLVTLAVIAYGVLFLFWPKEANELFVDTQPENTLQFMGVLFLLSGAGLNQMVHSSTYEGEMMSRMAFSWSVLLYMLAAAGGIVVTVMDDQLFVDAQNMAFLLMFALFAGALLLGFCGTLGGFCIFQSKTNVELESVVEVPSIKKTSASRRGVSRSDVKSGQRR
jgi:drug/metabolite transporter (DMT)-like permease